MTEAEILEGLDLDTPEMEGVEDHLLACIEEEKAKGTPEDAKNLVSLRSMLKNEKARQEKVERAYAEVEKLKVTHPEYFGVTQETQQRPITGTTSAHAVATNKKEDAQQKHKNGPQPTQEKHITDTTTAHAASMWWPKNSTTKTQEKHITDTTTAHVVATPAGSLCRLHFSLFEDERAWVLGAAAAKRISVSQYLRDLVRADMRP